MERKMGEEEEVQHRDVKSKFNFSQPKGKLLTNLLLLMDADRPIPMSCMSCVCCDAFLSYVWPKIDCIYCTALTESAAWLLCCFCRSIIIVSYLLFSFCHFHFILNLNKIENFSCSSLFLLILRFYCVQIENCIFNISGT